VTNVHNAVETFQPIKGRFADLWLVFVTKYGSSVSRKTSNLHC